MQTIKAAGVFFFALIMGVAVAAAAPGVSRVGIITRPLAAVTPVAGPALQRMRALPTLPSANIGGFPNHPLLAQLPPLPAKSEANTMRPGKSNLRPMAANGDSITITAYYECGGDLGQIYAVGCEIQWRFNEAVQTNADQLEDCYAPSTTSSTTANCTTAHTANPWEQTTMGTAGTWVFGTYDTTTGKWLAVVYLPVGSTGVYLDTFSDQFDKDESGQFTAASGTDVYIEATGLDSGSEKYEVYVEYTSVSPYCVYTAPSESPTPAPNGLCNPGNDSGTLTTSNGTLQVAWPLLTSYPAGTYSIVLYDVTAGQRLAQREVSIKGASSGTGTVSITPQGGNSSPNPVPSQTPGSVFAYDGQNDDSVGDLYFAGSNLGYNGQIEVVVSDPTGQVQYTISGNSNSDTYSGQSQNIQTLMTPSYYPFDTWTAQIVNSSTYAVLATQSFRMVGYSVQTEFTNPISTSLQISTTQAATTLQFTNTAATNYGSGNGDPIRGIYFNTGANGIVLTLGNGTSSTSGVCAGATACQTETAVDSAGVSWSVYNYCSSTGNTETCSIYATPMTTGTALAVGANLTLSNVEYVKNSTGTNCTTGCEAVTSILPQDGPTWSSTSSSSPAWNPVYFTQGSGSTTYAASGHMYLYGYRNASGTLVANEEAHGYTVNAASAGKTSVTYTSTSPSSSGTAKLVYAINIANNSSSGAGGISKFDITLPSQFSGGLSGATIDANSPTAWQIVSCPGGTPADTLCFQQGSGNNNGIVVGGNQTLYLDIAPPSSSLTYTDATIQVESPSVYPVTPDGSWTVFAGATPGPDTVDSTALVGYSLNSTFMTVATSPQSIGQNSTQNIAFTVTNTGFGSDTNPEYLDAIEIAVPTADTFNTFSVTNTGWSELGSYVNGTNTFYVFGLCSTQASSAYGPLGGTSTDMPNCGQSTEQADAIGPGGTLNFTANLTSGTGNVSMLMYAHGANGNGWSASKSFTETVTTTSLDAGFSNIGASPPPAISTGSIPTVGADTSSTLGNYYVYTIQNTSATGASNNVSSMTITIPGEDTSGNNGTDGSGKTWTITSAPTLSGTGFSGCSVTSYTSATTGGANGSIVIGGSGCSLTPGGVMHVDFTAQAPYRVNDTYNFPLSALNGATSVPVTPTWSDDTEVEIVLSAAVGITIDPSSNATTGTSPSPNCPACTFTAPATISMGSVANNSSVLGTDVAEVDVTTDASSPEGWTLYISTNVNPSNTGGTYTNEFVTSVDSSHSVSGAGVNYDQTSLAVVPTSGTLKLVDTGSGSSPRRNPFGLVMNYEVYISGGPTSPEDATVTYTFIAN
ncbi:MAG TPA: hypothetical protein VMA98_07285 [Candidatus Acidoferrales bacterium]|nr:hypothetical protein [Candidatus Acidoferrales bacterium]